MLRDLVPTWKVWAGSQSQPESVINWTAYKNVTGSRPHPKLIKLKPLGISIDNTNKSSSTGVQLPKLEKSGFSRKLEEENKKKKIQATLSRRFRPKGISEITIGSRFIDKRRFYLVSVWFHSSFQMRTTITHPCVGGYDPIEKKFVPSEQEGPIAGVPAMNKQERIGCRAQGEEVNLH